ncbi:9215_t:CDS:2, partial [Ambispora leptoticha]
MNMILTGDGHNNIERKNSLKTPASNQYDIVITNMPFSLKGPFEEYKDNYYLGKANGNSLYRNEEEKLKNGFQKIEMGEIEKNHFISVPGLYKKFDFEESKHEIIPLSELIEEQDNFVLQEERFKERVAAKDTSDYKLVPPRHFAYRPPGVNVGYICYNDKEMTGCITAYYPVFKVKHENKIKPEYLFCVCQSEKFREQADAFFRGTARPSINFTDFCKIKIPVPSLEEQEKKIRDICDANPSKSEIKDKKGIKVSFLPMEDLEKYSLRVCPKQVRKIEEVYQSYTYFAENDLLIAKITPCFENGKMSIAKNLVNRIGFEVGKTIMTGTVGQQRIKPNFVGDYSITLPPLEIQKEFVEELKKDEI